jgi:hypothetical protein
LLYTLLPKIHSLTMDKKRQCLLCGSATTYIHKSKTNSHKPYKTWYKFSGGFMCNVCYNRRRREIMEDGDIRNTLKYPSEKFCCVCGSRETKTDKNNGRPIWRFVKGDDTNKGRLCYQCYLAQRRNKSKIQSNWIICKSDVCHRQRKETIIGHDYSKYNRCTNCLTNWPKTETRCLCCGGPLRFMPKKAKAGYTKRGMPIVYY